VPRTTHQYENWVHEYADEVGHHKVFPTLNGKKLEHKPITALFDREFTNIEMLERHQRGVAMIHAFEHATHHVANEHFKSGHFEWAVNNVAKNMGFNDVNHAAEHAARNYVNGRHMVYANTPVLQEMGIFKLFKDIDPERHTRPYEHEYFATVHGITDRGELIDYLKRIHTQEELAGIRITVYRRHPNAIELEVLYTRDCFTTHPRNFLCLPPAPKGRFNTTDLHALLIPFELDENTACADIFEPEECSISDVLHACEFTVVAML